MKNYNSKFKIAKYHFQGDCSKTVIPADAGIQKDEKKDWIPDIFSKTQKFRNDRRDNLIVFKQSLQGGFAGLVIIFLIAGILAVAGGVYFAMRKQDVKKSENKPSSAAAPTIILNSTSVAPITVNIAPTSSYSLALLDCGNVVMSSFSLSVDSNSTSSGTLLDTDPKGEKAKQCFKNNFAQCKPAKVTINLVDWAEMYYEIIGTRGTSCSVKSKYTKNPNPKWINKEMVCQYDNKKDFYTAKDNIDNCSGPLYNLMHGK